MKKIEFEIREESEWAVHFGDFERVELNENIGEGLSVYQMFYREVDNNSETRKDYIEYLNSQNHD